MEEGWSGKVGRRDGVQLERMPVTMSGPLGCQTSVNVQQRPALPRRRYLMAFRHDCTAYGLAYGLNPLAACRLPSTVYRLPSSGLWLFGQHRADDVRAHNEVRMSRPFDRSSDNVATSASNRLQ